MKHRSKSSQRKSKPSRKPFTNETKNKPIISSSDKCDLHHHHHTDDCNKRYKYVFLRSDCGIDIKMTSRDSLSNSDRPILGPESKVKYDTALDITHQETIDYIRSDMELLLEEVMLKLSEKVHTNDDPIINCSTAVSSSKYVTLDHDSRIISMPLNHAIFDSINKLCLMEPTSESYDITKEYQSRKPHWTIKEHYSKLLDLRIKCLAKKYGRNLSKLKKQITTLDIVIRKKQNYGYKSVVFSNSSTGYSQVFVISVDHYNKYKLGKIGEEDEENDGDGDVDDDDDDDDNGGPLPMTFSTLMCEE